MQDVSSEAIVDCTAAAIPSAHRVGVFRRTASMPPNPILLEMQSRGTYQTLPPDDDDYDRQLPDDDAFYSSSSSSRSSSSSSSSRFSFRHYLRGVADFYHSLPSLWQLRLKYAVGCLLAFLLLVLLLASSASHKDRGSQSPPKPIPSPSSSPSLSSSLRFLKPLPSASDVIPSSAFALPPSSPLTLLGLTLPNRLEALLISSPSTPLSSASLAVLSGSWSDPSYYLGLSHFLEHMLFLGTERYPDESAFSLFLSSHGGYTNAYTAEDRTVYFFTVDPSAFPAAVDRFSAFFTAPLLSADGAEREVKAVNSEHEKNLHNDEWRLYELVRATSSTSHPFHQYGTGTADTLHGGGEGTRAALMSLYRREYVSRNMKLVLVGRESVDELRALAEQWFGEVPDNATFAPPRWGGEAFPAEPPGRYLGRVLYVQPIRTMHQLTLFFPLTSTTLAYTTNPTAYVAFLLGYEGDGSLLHFVKSLGWGSGVEVGMLEDEVELNVLQVVYQLTEEGVSHWEDILTETFAMLELIRADGVSEERWDEQRRVREIAFVYGPTPTAMELSSTLSARLQTVAMEDVLLPPSRLRWDEAAVRAVLAEMEVERAVIHVVSSSFEDRLFTDVEPIYGTRYHAFPISAELVKMVHRKQSDISHHRPLNLSLPSPNPFLFTPHPSSVRAPSLSTENVELSPTLHHGAFGERLWYLRDGQFGQPKVLMAIDIIPPLSTHASLSAFTLLALYTRLVASSFQSEGYQASLVGCSWSLTPSASGLSLTVSGYVESVASFVRALLPHVADPVVTEGRVALERRRFHDDLLNVRSSLAYQQAMYWMQWWVAGEGWLEEQVRAQLDSIAAANYTGYGRRILKDVVVEGVVYGQVQQSDVNDLVKAISGSAITLATSRAKTSNARDAAEAALFKERKARDIAIPPSAGRWLYQHAALNLEDANSAVLVHIPVAGVSSVASPLSACLSLLVSLIRQPAFDQLRTSEQLGYIVSAAAQSFGRSGGWSGLTIVVQGVEAGAVDMDERVDAFLSAFLAHLTSLTAAEFGDLRARAADEVGRRRERMEEVAEELMAEVRTGRRQWNRRADEAAAVRRVTLDEFVEFYKERVLGEGRRRFSVEVVNRKDEEGGRGRYRQPGGDAAVEDDNFLRDARRDAIRTAWAGDGGL